MSREIAQFEALLDTLADLFTNGNTTQIARFLSDKNIRSYKAWQNNLAEYMEFQDFMIKNTEAQ